MNIRIKALDTLFFKDGKPFSMGEETWADGIFPPSPSVIYGALRTAYFGENPDKFYKAGNSGDPTNNLIITSIHFDFSNAKYFPIPLDYVTKKNKNENKGYLMKLNEPDFLYNQNTKFILHPGFEEEVSSIENALITEGLINRYVNGGEETVSYQSLNDLVLSEPKVGIGRSNATRTSEEGKLYRVGMRRLSTKKGFGQNELSIIVDTDGLTFYNNGFFKLGAEGKISEYIIEEDKFDLEINDLNFGNSDNIFKIYLLTPAFLNNGWLPDFSNGIFKDINVEFVTACIGKPISIGGFDMKANKPKPMRKAVPAGSVYYFKTDKEFKEIYESLHGKSISDYLSDEGFGISYIGKVKNINL